MPGTAQREKEKGEQNEVRKKMKLRTKQKELNGGIRKSIRFLEILGPAVWPSG